MPVSARSAESVAAKGAVIPPWAHKLPGCLFAVLKFLYFDLLLPDDSFEVSMRKLLMAVGPYAFVFGPVAVGGLFTLSGTYTWNAASFVAGTAQAAFGLLWFTLLIAAKLNPRLGGTDLFVDLWIGVAAFLACVASFAVPAVAWDVCVALISFVAIIFRSRVRVPVALLTSVVAMLSVYNRGVFNSGGSTSGPPLVAFPNAATPNHLWVQLVADEAIYLLHLPVWFCLEVFLRESDRRHAASIASVELAKRLAAALSRYDTKSAREALDSMGTDGEVAADAELVEGFRSIVANLDEYRPHLPNWLVTKHSASTGEDEEDEGDATGSLALHSATGTFRRSDDDNDDDYSSQSSKSKRRTPTHAGGGRAAVPKSPAAANTLRTHRVALAELDLSTHTAGAAAAAKAATLHAFVDRVHDVARETKAAVHAFVGDAVVASWNAASACAQPEAKAARFAARLRAHAAAHGGSHGSAAPAVRVTGAVAAGVGTVLMAGLGEQRALLASLGAPAMAALRRARAVGGERDAVLVPGSVAKTAHYAAHFRLAAALRRSTSGASATVVNPQQTSAVCGEIPGALSGTTVVSATKEEVELLYAVVGEVTDGGDEWMYVLEQQQRQGEDANACALEVTEACEAGEFATALARLHTAASSAHTLQWLADDLRVLSSTC